MTIYFAGSIRGGRGDQAIYEEIIARLGTTAHVKDVDGILRQALAPARL